MWFVLRVVSLRHLSGEPLRTILTLVGIALGVAAVFASQVINRAVLASVTQAVDQVAGKTSLSVGAGAGIEESALDVLRSVSGVDAALPVIEETVHDAERDTELAVLAVDTLSDASAQGVAASFGTAKVHDELGFLNDPHGILITQEYGDRAGLHVGDVLRLDTALGTQEFRIHGLLEASAASSVFGGELLVMDVYAAQLAFERGRRFDRVDIVATAGTDVDRLAADLAQALSHTVEVSRPSRRTAEAEQILRGFSLALSLASLVAIFVGAFIVYNALAIAVARRRREVGTLRTLGMEPRRVLYLFVGEGLITGALGSLLGVGLGRALASAALSLVTSTVSELYMSVRAQAFEVHTADLTLSLAIGLLASLGAAWFPARRAAGLQPVVAMQRRDPGATSRSRGPRRSVGGSSACFVLALASAYGASRYHEIRLGFLATVFFALMAATSAPLVAATVGRWTVPLLRLGGPVPELAALSFRRNVARNSVAVAALGMALANVVNTNALLDSMKQTTSSWLGRSFRADLFVFGGRSVRARFDRPLPESIGAALEQDGAVRFVQAFRMSRQSYRGQPYYLMSERMEGYRELNELAAVEGDVSDALPRMMEGSAIAASQTFAHTFGVRLHDILSLQTGVGVRKFSVELIYVDYRSDLGVLLLDRAVYQRLWRDDRVDLYGIYLVPGAQADTVRSQIIERWGKAHQLRVLANQTYMGELLGLIDRALAMSHASELVALLVAVLGLVNTLLVGVLDRRTEFGVLKAIGASRAQVRGVVLAESALMGCASTVSGVWLGLLLSAYAVYALLPLQVGWNMSWHPSAWVVVQTLALAQLTAVLAAWWPMRAVEKLEVVEAIKYE